MFDNITLVKKSLTTSEKLQVIETNNLQSFVNEANGTKIYDNLKTKNLNGGIFIRIQNNKLKIEGSIHKYFNFLKYRTLENYTVFTMQDFINTIEILFRNFGINPADLLLINYEIGLNVFIGEADPINFLKNVKTVGNSDGTQRKLYINPKFKNERFLTTQMHRDNTLVFRIYDKGLERIDKGKKTKIKPCIRIETKRTRQKEILFSNFCKPNNLLIIQDKFFSEWNTLTFDQDISAPAGTHQSKKDLAKKIILQGKEIVLKEIEENKENYTLKIYRNYKEFIKNWDLIKFNFQLKNSQICALWGKYYNISIQQVAKNTIKI